MGLNTKCPIHGNEHPDYLCPDAEPVTEQLVQREDGGWYRECGCRFDYWNGLVAPSVHLCARHAAERKEQR